MKSYHFKNVGRQVFICIASGWILLSASGGSAQAQIFDSPPCAGDELAAANAALSQVGPVLDKAIAALKNPNVSDAAYMDVWLGIKSHPSPAADNVISILERSRAFVSGVNFRCAVKSTTLYARVRSTVPFTIDLHRGFFIALPHGYSSRPGILIHEMSHFLLTGGTADPSTRSLYGTEPARERASKDPAAAQRNAENIEYFVESIAL
ncbi:hypothetical protein JMG10_16590 [Nostoc ellipsosporum NOK]|uniref:M35 family metallo-endopeptidase n=1 Tax=Sphingomonas sp. IBVSS2 TaxID=1985172 RepID=UPI000A2DFCE4|nr:M35 family metallo-endopeptidase [Sphingomonas sp. IBVSS2]MDF2383104.1 hypothetical protein [Nostoc ellipsosporum NOK]OSZ69597.1 hypothetical protein CAP40_01725 [Sphingomonas sp. IBVSS2]